MKPFIFALSFLAVFGYMSNKYIFATASQENSVLGISHSLACPCECPMVLEDCHMSCGLEWKDVIGEKLKAGLVKADVVEYFFKRYGTEALLTPAQRFSGKWYEVTRGGYPVKDMVIFGLIILVWSSLLYSVVMVGVEKIQPPKKKV